ncbi:hypothetical protein [Gottfriedia acidiceleris]|uniref:Uncharacterized protein n=1 Tax=Gottfriedia acidiceleris TaxID=371036 RepID=A0ABY4JLU7_9BACI|nr:hypothetical protein [Gottfriedia acidiceleris]UPM54055.1 hypothetical protein MY490_20305 [Gottfriedia acidiceleris]
MKETKQKISKKIIALLTFGAIMVSPLVAQAATKSFTFDMEHQLSIGTYTSTKGSVTGTVNMESWGGDTYFTIHVYEKQNGSNVLITRLGFEKSTAGSPYVDTDDAVTTGHTYTYEIWKNMNGKRIKGSGTLSY